MEEDQSWDQKGQSNQRCDRMSSDDNRKSGRNELKIICKFCGLGESIERLNWKMLVKTLKDCIDCKN